MRRAAVCSAQAAAPAVLGGGSGAGSDSPQPSAAAVAAAAPVIVAVATGSGGNCGGGSLAGNRRAEEPAGAPATVAASLLSVEQASRWCRRAQCGRTIKKGARSSCGLQFSGEPRGDRPGAKADETRFPFPFRYPLLLSRHGAALRGTPLAIPDASTRAAVWCSAEGKIFCS